MYSHKCRQVYYIGSLGENKIPLQLVYNYAYLACSGITCKNPDSLSSSIVLDFMHICMNHSNRQEFPASLASHTLQGEKGCGLNGLVMYSTLERKQFAHAY